MEHCKTCKFWKPTPQDIAEYYIGGWCLNGKLTEFRGIGSYAPDALVYPYHEGVNEFWTGSEFGCVHHEPKP